MMRSTALEPILISFYDSENPDAKPIGQAHAIREYFHQTFQDGEKNPVKDSEIADTVQLIVYRLTEDGQFSEGKVAKNVQHSSVMYGSKQIAVIAITEQKDYKINMRFIEVLR